MWTLKDKILLDELPCRQTVIRFNFTDAVSQWPTYWAIALPGKGVEICHSDPGHDVDLCVETEVGVTTGIHLGRRLVAREIDAGRLYLTGDMALVRTIDRWLRLSVHAATPGPAKA